MRDVDKGHAWLCFIGVLGAQFINGAIGYGPGVIHVALLEHFKEGVAKTSLVGSVFSNLLCLLAPVSSIAINLTSCRVSVLIGATLITAGLVISSFASDINIILLSYGIISGVGFSFTISTTIVIIGYAFERYRGLAIGISVAACGVGMFACGPITQYLIDTYSVFGAFLLLGGVSSHLFIFGTLMKPSGLEEKHKEYLKSNADKTGKCGILKRFLHFEIVRNTSFIFILISGIFFGLPYSLILLHLPNYSVTQGLTDGEGAFLITLIGLGSTVNRLLVGVASGDGGLDILLMYFGNIAICGISTLVFPLFSAGYLGQCIYSVIFGLYSGAVMALYSPICLDVVGIEQLPTAVGLLFFFLGIGGLIGPPVAGLIVDRGGTYEYSFYISGACFVISAMLTLFSTINRPVLPANLHQNANFSRSISSNNSPPRPMLFSGSGFNKGSGFMTGSGFITAPEIFAGSASFCGSGSISKQPTNSKYNLAEDVTLLPS